MQEVCMCYCYHFYYHFDLFLALLKTSEEDGMQQRAPDLSLGPLLRGHSVCTLVATNQATGAPSMAALSSLHGRKNEK